MRGIVRNTPENYSRNESLRRQRFDSADLIRGPRPREMAIPDGARLADGPCRWLFRLHADVLPRLAATVYRWGNSLGVRGTA